MYFEGKLVTAGEKARIHRGVWGVNKYVPEKCFDGFTLFSPSWDDTVYLVDMRGLVVHTWPVTHSNTGEILPNGNLFTHNCSGGAHGKGWIEEIAPDGEVVWRWDGEGCGLTTVNHHDYCYVDEDNVLSLAARNAPCIPGFYAKGVQPGLMRNDVFLRINRKKEVVWEFSLGDHWEQLCDLAGLPIPIPYMRKTESGGFEPYGPIDWAHANTIESLPATPLGERDSRFREGNVLFSLRHLDTIGIADPEKNEIVWCYGLGILDGQHQPTMLENGNILVFDNGTYRRHSIVREIEPASGEIVWQYENGEDFFSPFRSGNQRLANGNTFICECDAGHLFEVTRDKEIVWDYWSPFVARGPLHLGKRIHRASRCSPAQVEPVLRARKDVIAAEMDEEGRRFESYADMIRFYQR